MHWVVCSAAKSLSRDWSSHQLGLARDNLPRASLCEKRDWLERHARMSLSGIQTDGEYAMFLCDWIPA